MLLSNIIPVIENIVAELERRFSDSIGIDAMIPSSDMFASFVCLRPLAEHYKSDLIDLEHELHNVKRLIEKKAQKPTTLVSLVSV